MLSSRIPAPAFIPMVPKIGMGKPAITKRKFSPGRPRVRQGMWATNPATSPSWSTDSYEFRESLVKYKQPHSTIWSIKVGRGAGFPGKKRPRGAGHPGRGGKGRSKLKNGLGALLTPGATSMEMVATKDEDENTMHNTVVLFSTNDKFTLKQDMCVVCGSFGKGSEGRLLACSQCGQCYHPYCVSIKITKVVLSKGWRCLECTVCESCGKASDPGRLLLCDDCDISYHTYCLDPPLQTVPKGGWKCKWCVCCLQCGSTLPGFKCEWQNNYAQCSPCASLATCPVCGKNYREEEIIIQCRQCDRWMHASCQSLTTEDEVEAAADSGFDCFTCRQYVPTTPVTTSEAKELTLATPQVFTKMKESEPTRTYTQDGVCLTELGMSQLQSLSVAAPRRKRPKPKLKLKIINQNSVAVLQASVDPQSEQSRDMEGDVEDNRETDLMDCDTKSDILTSPEQEPPDDETKVVEGSDILKKRKRKPYRPGIGGFMVRQRQSRTGQNKAKRSLSRKSSTGSVSETIGSKEDGWIEQMPEHPADDSATGAEIAEKMKKRYRKKKNKLEEIFPAYLQEAFFGKTLLDTGRQSKRRSLEALSDEDSTQLLSRVQMTSISFMNPSSEPLLSSATAQLPAKAAGGQGDPLADLSEVLTTEVDILGMLSDELGKTGDDSAGLNIGHMSDDPSSTSQSSGGQSSRPLTEEQLDRILSPDLEKIVTDGTILSKLYKIPELEGKEVEDLFTAVLSPSANQRAPPPDHGEGGFPRVAAMNGLMRANQQHQSPLTPGSGPCLSNTYSPMPPSPFPENSREKSHRFSPVISEPAGPWISSAPAVEVEGDSLNYTQRSTLKWEKEEALGEMATVAPVLYTNTNFPNLKEDFPDWATRVKQIAKLWRKASSQERAPYVQKARDNRAALRINKVQITSESLRRQQQECVDSVTRPDADLPFKDQMKQKESEHEQEWKMRQQMRQKSKQQAKIEATQKLEQVKHEQQQQQQQQQQFGAQEQLEGEDSPEHGSPLQTKEVFTVRSQVQGDATDDVFLRPQAPPPTPTRASLQDPFSQSQTPQPQMFPPTVNRPSSPWDPYAKMVGTPRPPPLQTVARRNSAPPLESCTSPQGGARPGGGSEASESFGSLSPGSSDPYAKAPDTPRPIMCVSPADHFPKALGLPRGLATSDPQASMLGTTGDHFVKPAARPESFAPRLQPPPGRTLPPDPYARPGGEAGGGHLFKAPMPPPQDPYGPVSPSPRRLPIDPYERHPLTPRPADSFLLPVDPYAQPLHNPRLGTETFPHPPRVSRPNQVDSFPQPGAVSRQRSPHDPYSQLPGTPRPAIDPYTQQPGTPRPQPQQIEPYSQQPSTPRPPPQQIDPYAQQPGTPRPQPQQIDPYAQQPSTPRPQPQQIDPYAQQPGTPRPQPQQTDPYAQQPGTPRPQPQQIDPYAQQPGTPRPQPQQIDPYAQQPGTPRPQHQQIDPYVQQPGTPRPQPQQIDPYAQQPGTPRPQPQQLDPYSQQPSTPRPQSQQIDPYAQQPGTPRPPPQQIDPYAHQPGTPRPQVGERFAQSPVSQRFSDPYAQAPLTPRPTRPDHFSQAQRLMMPESFGRPRMMRPVLLVGQDAFMPSLHASRGPGLQDAFARPRTPQGSRQDGGPFSPHAPGPRPMAHDPYAQQPGTPRPPPSEGFRPARLHHDMGILQGTEPAHFGNSSGSPMNNPPAQQFPGVPAAMDPVPSDPQNNRQRLRELILRQQQQKNAIRQEKGQQEHVIGSSVTLLRHWPQEDLNRQNELFGRPPPPYPGNVRVPLIPQPGQRFADSFQNVPRARFTADPQYNRTQFSGDITRIVMRPQGPRYSFAGSDLRPMLSQEHYLGPQQQRQAHGAGIPQQLRRSLSVDLSRSLSVQQVNNGLTLPQHFPPQGVQMQQHNIHGQPFIELRHRTPESRARLPFAQVGPGPSGFDPSNQHPRLGVFMSGQEGFPLVQGLRQLDSISVQHGMPNHMEMPGNLVQQMHVNHPGMPLSRSLSNPPSSQTYSSMLALGTGNACAQESDGMVEKLDPDDPSVKDLDDKDLEGVRDLDDEDLENLNLDPVDEKGDPDLDNLNIETNDPHLDDLLKSGEFDLIAYTDPELDLADKKDMFNEELELNDPMDDKLEDESKVEADQARVGETAGAFTPKEEAIEATNEGPGESCPKDPTDTVKLEPSGADDRSGASCVEGVTESKMADVPKERGPDCNSREDGDVEQVKEDERLDGNRGSSEMSPDSRSSSQMAVSTPVLSSLLTEKPTNLGFGSLGSLLPQSNPNPNMPLSPSMVISQGQTAENTASHNLQLGQRLIHGFTQGPSLNQNFLQEQQAASQPGNTATPQQMMLPQTMGPQGQRERPLLLEEQPLLLQDLLEQERQEQQQQRQMQAMIRHRSTDSFFPNIDFDAITDPIMKAKMVALKGINRVMAQNNLGMPPIVMNRFPFMGQQISGNPSNDGGQNPINQGVGSDGSLPPQMSRPNPPTFGPGFLNDAQRKQYEEWLQETQQLLQMQQKFLEEQIGVHRKSKKALSAKQRTAKKAGREFPEEDAEQLKNVTEQQSMVQKQLEQIRKQQKEHGELMEQYRIKQQCPMPSPTLLSAVPPQALPVQGGPPASQLQPPIAGQPTPPRMPNAPQPHHLPMAIARMQPPGASPASVPPPAMASGPPPPAQGGGTTPGPAPGPQQQPPPRVEFDDNNPFSESFQERERRDRLREQQERQRIQLMQEVERHRALQKRMEMEQQQQQQQGMLADMNRSTLCQMPYYNNDLPHDFLHSPRPQGHAPAGPAPRFLGSPPAFISCGERRLQGQPGFGPEAPIHHPPPALGFLQAQPRIPFPAGGAGLPQGRGEPAPFGSDTTAHLPGQSLIQLYSNIIPEEKGKKKRSRKKKSEGEEGEPVHTPSTPRSDHTAPPTPTPSYSDSASIPSLGEPGAEPDYRGPEQPPTELERQLSAQTLGPHTSSNPDPPHACPGEVKTERADEVQCQGQPKAESASPVKVEEDNKATVPPSPTEQSAAPLPGAKQELGNELLKHLLKNKNPPLLPHQRPEDGPYLESKMARKLTEGLMPVDCRMQTAPSGFSFDGKVCQLQKRELEEETKRPKTKRGQKMGEKALPRSKKRKKAEEDRQAVYPNTDALMNQLKQQLTLLPLMEPTIGVNFAYFPPYGSGQLNDENQLMGSFGNGALDGVPDYYSQLIYKQNNLSNPPTPPASLPPTPPPVARQKMVNGFATTEELTSKAGVIGHHDVTKGLGPKQYQLPFRPEDDLLARAIAHGPKTVDVPASLPTPPHNNQEELRGQDHCDQDDCGDSSDSFVASSSPESVVGLEVSRYPDLSLVKEEPPDPASSPVIPILPSSAGKGSEARRNDMKLEAMSGNTGSMFFGSQFGQSQNGPKIGLVSVALTLTPTAAEDINGVVAAVADLLRVKVPNSYEVSNASEPPSMALLNTYKYNQAPEGRPPYSPHPGLTGPIRIVRSAGQQGLPYVTLPGGTISMKTDHRAVVDSSASTKPQWCRHCDVVVLGNGVRKTVMDLPCHKPDSRDRMWKVEADIVFCSNSCFLQYSMATQARTPESKEGALLATEQPVKEMVRNTFHHYNNNTSALDVHRLPRLQENTASATTPALCFPPACSELPKQEPKAEDLKVTVKLKPRPRSLHGSLDETRPVLKRWKGMKWKKWRVQIVIPKGHLKVPSEQEIDELLKRLGTSLKPEPIPRDYRRCCFCHEEGDGTTDGAARLLNLDLDLWVHLNCALWSTEVYETQAGALINVEVALRRGLSMKCVFCHKMGATSTCHRIRCTNVYHFTCAGKAQCMFFKDKTMLCPLHKPRGPHEQELTYFAVFRRVYVQRDEVKQVASIVQRGERNHTFRVGSLIFHAIGQLLPQQMQDFHSRLALYPVGYEASRLYWSTRYCNKRSRYLCSIEERDGLPEFLIRVIEQGHEDQVLKGSSPKAVWEKLLEPIARLRRDADMLKLFPDYLKGDDLFGLTVSAVTRIAESLPGVESCENYMFRYGRNPLMELPLAINPSGCARSEPKMSIHVKRPHTLNSTTTSKSFQSTVTGELNAPYSKQFVHSKSSQYRKMKTEWKINVYLARSRIQGLGLYAARDIEKHTMVIEYIGTIIRNEVANRREKLYESQNRGVYMFRIDNDHVIDATLTGGPARYINHSCAPNCVAEVVTFEKGHKIIISSNRRIQKGEELSYDYKFDFEDDQHKIPCHCGAVNCRKWMN
eukprot:gi/632982228/ref/XP_007908022.1/ PREDICTED: histone-lysine N-methyltransferase 2C [Callorhinchus milii]